MGTFYNFYRPLPAINANKMIKLKLPTLMKPRANVLFLLPNILELLNYIHF